MRIPITAAGIDPKTNYIWVVRLRVPFVAYVVHIETRTHDAGPPHEPENYPHPMALFPNSGKAKLSAGDKRGLRLSSADFVGKSPWPKFTNGTIVANLEVPKFLNVASTHGEYGVVDLTEPQRPRYAAVIDANLDTPTPFEGISRFDGKRWVHDLRGHGDAHALFFPFAKRLSDGFMGLDPISIQLQALGIEPYTSLTKMIDLHHRGIKPEPRVKPPIRMRKTINRSVNIFYKDVMIVTTVPVDVARNWYERYVAGCADARQLAEALYDNTVNPPLQNRALMIAAAPKDMPALPLPMTA